MRVSKVKKQKEQFNNDHMLANWFPVQSFELALRYFALLSEKI